MRKRSILILIALIWALSVIPAFAEALDITVNAPDGTYYIAQEKAVNQYYSMWTKVYAVTVSDGQASVAIDGNGGTLRLLSLNPGYSYNADYQAPYYTTVGSFYHTGSESCTVSKTADTITITPAGSQNVSQDQVLSAFGMARNFMIVAEKFYQTQHYEGNIAVDHYYHTSGQAGGFSGNRLKNFSVVVTKTVQPAAAKTFWFRVVDEKGNQVGNDFSITTDADTGAGSHTFVIQDAKCLYSVYEVDGRGGEVKKSGDELLLDGVTYTVSYEGNNTVGEKEQIILYANTDFAKEIHRTDESKPVEFNGGNVMYTTTSGVTGQNGTVITVTNAEFNSMINVSDMLNSVSGISETLAKAKTGSDIVVYHLDAENLCNVSNGNKIIYPAVPEDAILVINVVIPDGIQLNSADSYQWKSWLTDEQNEQARNEWTAFRFGENVNEIKFGSETLTNVSYYTDAKATLINRTVWNFVDENGNPYTGNVSISRQVGGTFLLPEGTIYVGNSAPAVGIYAENVVQSMGEIHKASVYADKMTEEKISISNRTAAPETTDVPVSKVWQAHVNTSYASASSVTVALYANGTATGKTVTLNAANSWSDTFTGLAVKDAAGSEITYTVRETVPAGYEPVSITGDAKTGYVITNKPTTVDISGKKTWNDENDRDGLRPKSITIRLLADGKEVDSKVVTAADGWKWSFTGKDEYNGDNKITYTIAEDAVPDYSGTVSGYDVINTHEHLKTTVSVHKVWEDHHDTVNKLPGRVTVELVRNGTPTGTRLTLTADNNWSGTFSGLDVNDESGTPITYTVREEAVPGYVQVSVTGNAREGYTITNCPTYIDISGKKTWVDKDDADGVRPDSITIRLYADGREVAYKKVTAADGWKWSFTGMDEYNGTQKIVYTISEDDVPLYISTVSGYNVTNKHSPITDIPKTGDGHPLGLLVCLTLLSGGMALALKKRK